MQLFLVTFLFAAVLHSGLALTQNEVAAFTARSRNEKNTNAQGTVTITESGENYVLTSNGIPDHDTGTFPSAGTNPNSITTQSHSITFPKSPQVAAQETCLPMGVIGYATNGVPYFNPYTSRGYNAVEGQYAEVFDSCDGHPDQNSRYHYHQLPSCLAGITNPDQIVGVALDGFPIYGPVKANGNNVTKAELDTCHGMVVGGSYRYYVTYDFPYILGCFKGSVALSQMQLNNCNVAVNDSIVVGGQNGGGGAGRTMPSCPPPGASPPPGATLPPGCEASTMPSVGNTVEVVAISIFSALFVLFLAF